MKNRWAMFCATAGIASLASLAGGTVPIDGFLPMVGIALTDEFDDNFNFFPNPTTSPSGTLLGAGGSAHYDVALLDTGAGFSLLNDQGFDDFGLDEQYPGENDGFVGTESVPIGGATGQLLAPINDPFGLYAGGLQSRTAEGASLVMDHAGLSGQTNTSTITLPPESELPNVLGLPFASQYATRIRNDAPQIFELEGKTVRTPAIDFLPLGSGGNGIVRKAPLSLNPGPTFTSPPGYLPNIANFDIDKPQENPTLPTAMQGGLFLNASTTNDGNALGNKEFFFDTGASVTVVSELNALLLGFDVLTDTPEFTISILGSGGTTDNVPGFFVDEITLVALGGSITATNVPVIVLDVTDPSDAGNIVEGIIGTNLFAGRNLVIDPNPSIGGGGASAGLYISDPVTNDFVWTSSSPSAAWSTGSAWDAAATPDLLSVARVEHVAGGDQEAVVAGSQEAWDLVVRGGNSGETMTLRIAPSAELTTFSGTTIETDGVLRLQDATLDTQYLDLRGGTLTGEGEVRTGSGPLAGQVESISGTVAPGEGVGTLTLHGRYVSGEGATLALELGGTVPGSQHDQLLIEGTAALGGTLSVALVDLGSGLFAPSAGDLFELITFTEGGGEFDALDLPTSLPWKVHYEATQVRLELLGSGLAGDLNGDGQVDAADYTVWRDGFNSVYNQAVYQLWVDNYGNSLSSSSNSVPEPSTWLIALAALLPTHLMASRRGSAVTSGSYCLPCLFSTVLHRF